MFMIVVMGKIELFSRSVGNWSRSHDLLGYFLIMMRTSLVVQGVNSIVFFQKVVVHGKRSHYH